jgi:hypothetical protein
MNELPILKGVGPEIVPEIMSVPGSRIEEGWNAELAVGATIRKAWARQQDV